MTQELAELFAKNKIWRARDLSENIRPSISSDIPSLDTALPDKGWPVGSLIDVINTDAGIGKISFLFSLLAQEKVLERRILWIAPPYLPYVPALQEAGVLLQRCLVVSPESKRDAIWIAEQSLRAGACGTILAWLESPHAVLDSATAITYRGKK